MSIFKGKKEKGPPDVGKETEIEFDGDGMADSLGDFDGGTSERRNKTDRSAVLRGREQKGVSAREAGRTVSLETPELIPSYSRASPTSPASSANGNASSFELEKINARLEMLNSLITGFNERISGINQQIGEIRAMAIANEKNLSLSNLEAKKVVDIVKEVDPEKLRLDYQRTDFKMSSFISRLESYKQYMDSIMEELKELKRKANLFEGSEAILKLNDDVKKDLIQIQKVNSKVRLNADKSEQIFVELSKGFHESQKINEMVANLDESYSSLKKDIEKLNLDYSKILDVSDFGEFKNEMGRKLIALNNNLSEVEKIKNENETLSKMIGKILLMEKRNEEDIANVKLNKDGGEVKKISDYEEKLFTLLELTEKMADEIGRIKEKLGIRVSAPIAVSQSAGAAVAGGSEIKRTTSESSGKINNLLAIGKANMNNGNLTGALEVYKQIFQLYKPAEDANRTMYNKIINYYDTLSDLMRMQSVGKGVSDGNRSENNSEEPSPVEAGRYKRLSDY